MLLAIFVSVCTVFAAPANAQYVTPSTTTSGGSLFVWNSASGVVSYCYGFISGTSITNSAGCATVATFAPSSAVRLVDGLGGVLYLVDGASGRVMLCVPIIFAAGTSTAVCKMLATKLP
jgi:hypothetical protein